MSTEIRCDKCGTKIPAALVWKFKPEPSKELQIEGYGIEHSDVCHKCKEEWFDGHVYATFRKRPLHLREREDTP